MSDNDAVDLALLTRELTAAGVLPETPLMTIDGTKGGLRTWAEDRITQVPLPPETDPVVDAHNGNRRAQAAAFETSEDTERLRLVNERARTDPAYAALADLALGTNWRTG